MKRILLPLTLLLLSIAAYAAYRLLVPRPITDTEMEVLVEAAGSAQYLTTLQQQDNQRLSQTITSLVTGHQDRPKDLETVEKIAFVEQKTRDIGTKAADLRLEAIRSVGASPEKITNRQRKVRIDQAKVFELIFQIKHYTDTLGALAEIPIASLLYGPQDEALTPFRYYQYYLKDKSLGVFLLNLSRLENQLVNAEKQAIVHLARFTNFVDFSFDSIVPLVEVSDNVVNQGDTYEAKISFMAIDPDIPYYMSVDNQPIAAERGIGKLVLPPSKFPKTGKFKHFRGAVSVITRSGTMTYGEKHEFSVREK